MKKIFALAFCVSLALCAGFAGCKKSSDKADPANKPKEAKADVKAIEKDFCDLTKMTGLILSDAYAEYMGRAEYAAESKNGKPSMTEEQAVAKMVGDMKQDMKGDMFASCTKAAVQDVKCEDAFKQLAAEKDGPGKMLGADAEKTLAEIGKKMDIKACAIVTVTAKTKDSDKDETVKMYAGDVKGKTQAFWVIEP